MTERSGGTVRDFMHRSLGVIQPGATIVAAAVRMRDKSLGSLLVSSADDEGLVSNRSGIVTETDLIRKVLAKDMEPSRARVDQIMTSPLLTIAPDRPMLDASQLMEINHVRHLGVSDEENIVGIISVRDLVRYFIDLGGAPFVTSTTYSTPSVHSAYSCKQRWRPLRVSGRCWRQRRRWRRSGSDGREQGRRALVCAGSGQDGVHQRRTSVPSQFIT